jgi:hypothetical protein
LLRRLKLAPRPEQRPRDDDSAEKLLRWNERALLASKEMAVAGPAIGALARVSLMTGTAVALVLFAQRDLARGGLVFAGGLFSSLWVSQIGRLASDHTAKLRGEWARGVGAPRGRTARRG